MDLGQNLPGAAEQVGFDLDAVRQVRPQAHFGDLPQLIDDLRHVVLRLAARRRIKRKAADQFRLESVGQLAGALDLFVEILFERYVAVLAAVLDVGQLDLADRRTDRGHVQPILVFQVADGRDLRPRQLGDVLAPPPISIQRML